MSFPSGSIESPVVLSPRDALARYHDELHLMTADEQMLVLPGVIGTVFFERGSKPDVRQGILTCFDQFEALFGEHLRGGKAADLGKFCKKTAAGVQAIRRAILDMPPHQEVSVVRSSATDQNTAAEYEIKTLTNIEAPEDTALPSGSYVFPKGEDGGQLSYIKFNVPMHLITTDAGLEIYQGFLRFICQTLPVRGGYGGLSPILPFRFHRFMPQEYELAMRFSGLEIDTYAFTEKDNYCIDSYKGESPETMTDCYNDLRPGAKVSSYGFIKGVNWYTLLGDVFVNRLGGEAALRSALARPDIGIERIKHCVLVRAGPFPRLGAPEEGLLNSMCSSTAYCVCCATPRPTRSIRIFPIQTMPIARLLRAG